MKSRAALLFQQPGKWEITEIDVGPPRQGELLVRMVASGLCHSDDHIATGDMPFTGALPLAGGHEGAGIVEEVGPHTEGFEVGDHVVLPFLPACGKCRWCSSGMQNLCDSGARTLSGARADGSLRLSLDGTPIGQMAGISTFSEYTALSVHSAVKISPDIDLVAACLTSCGVSTGWGAAVNSAEVRPGDVIIVVGIGGIGINAVQGAAQAGARVLIAVDPVEWKRTRAHEFGATHAVATIEEATEIARAHTNGQGADAAIVCVGVTNGTHIGSAFSSIRKAGTCVVVGLGNIMSDGSVPLSLHELVLFQKRLQGSLFGACSPVRDIPALLDLYRAGKLRLDELITNRYTLEQINDGFADMHAGRNLRGVITFG
ncbi:Alcohol dehydrogenase B [Frankia sp. AiPs1]|uniref:NDMA-dependent alcohol dehydrogenase n=1 Tax=Frankia sp. AiPa1 TaxID=573492 RepID=UPI00202B2F70|nr:NDMA-dependent alcohol dehydrogenase [Frankia sp. AiPa1]MCL9762725.1 NDMA-dependent alcohol dehydrogenase [Frankia sp. AiPa1]